MPDENRKNSGKDILLYAFLFAGLLYFSVTGLMAARVVLAPLVFGALLAMLMLPLTRRLEKWGVNRVLAVLLSDFLIIGFFVGLTFIVIGQFSSLARDFPKAKEKFAPKIQQAKQFIADKTGVSPQQLEQYVSSKVPFLGKQDSTGKSGQKPGQPQGGQSSIDAGKIMGVVSGFLTGLTETFAGFVLVFVYFFFLQYYRHKFKKSILNFFPKTARPEAGRVLAESSQVSQQYLLGRLLLMLFLAVFYAIGFAIIGVKQGILVAILAAVFSIIPYVGNVIGFVLSLAFSVFGSGGSSAVMGVLVIFTLAQFIENYFLEPFIVGEKVHLHPLFTILVVIVGATLWGIAGAILSIPLLGIAKVWCDHIPALQPIGYLIGDEGNDEGPSVFDKLKSWVLGLKS
ncbi:MAG: AI-2E family transporter [Cytophagales bacterium]|jgi:predicted PurR-regulated permease PerM|nr:AI-2E family transporter [Cytophagales bacterium]